MWGRQDRNRDELGGERADEGREGGKTDRSWHKALQQKARKEHYMIVYKDKLS